MIFKALLDNLSTHFIIHFRATVDYKIFFYLFPGMFNLFQSNTALMQIKSHFFSSSHFLYAIAPCRYCEWCQSK
jgi:hypothetical protein